MESEVTSTELKRSPEDIDQESTKRLKDGQQDNSSSNGVKIPVSENVKGSENISANFLQKTPQSETKSEENVSDSITAKSEVTKIKFPCKKKFAVMMGFCGEGYKGMAINKGVKTIEETLLDALLKCKLIKPENASVMHKMGFQRASRTDKGVSGARQVVSINLHLDEADIKSSVEKVNEALPKEIIVYDFIRTTKQFDAHHFASSRVYEYNCPTFAMAPTLGNTWSGYRIPAEQLQKVRDFLQNFVGTKNFFNYTSNKNPDDPSCFRYLRSITVSEPILVDKIEYLKIFLHGDSFIYHQIRKIVGMTIACIRNVAPLDHLEKSFSKERTDIPLAPGLGLVLDEVKMDRYNQKFGEDGQHKVLLWDSYEDIVQDFKTKNILSVIHRKEKAEDTMFIWLQTLKKHRFYTGDVLPKTLGGKTDESVELQSEASNKDNKTESKPIDESSDQSHAVAGEDTAS